MGVLYFGTVFKVTGWAVSEENSQPLGEAVLQKLGGRHGACLGSSFPEVKHDLGLCCCWGFCWLPT
jgi:hypothetical protein